MGQSLPLFGITVFDFGSNVAARFGLWILALDYSGRRQVLM